MKQGYIPSNGLNLYYEIHGDGKPMILLNGGPGFSHEYLLPITGLVEDAQCILYDQRGTGNSDKAPAESYTIANNVSDLENLRLSLGLDSFILFGHSWGGILAQAYVLQHPQAVSKLVLANTFSRTADINLALDRMRRAVPPETQAVFEHYERLGLYSDGDTYPEAYQDACEIAYEPVSLSVPPPESLTEMFSKIAYDVYRAMWGDQSEFLVTGTLAGFNAQPRLHEISQPTLVLVGASDMPSVEMAQEMAGSIPQAQLAVFQNSRHFPFIEEPERFRQVLGEFLFR